jgi:hypothetical protein
MRSNTPVFVSDPQFEAPPASILPGGQVPTVLLPANPPPAVPQPPAALEETIQNNENKVAQTLARMPALLDPGDDENENDNTEHGSNEEEGNDNPPPDDDHHFLLAADDDNEEDEHQDDIVENAGDGDDVLILENNDEHVIKRQLCEEEKKKLIVDGHTWTVGQMAWTAVANSVPTDPFPQISRVWDSRFQF